MRDWAIIVMVTVAGTLFCITIALLLDYPNIKALSGEMRAAAIRSNVVIPALLSPPFLSYLTWKIRLLEQAKAKLELLASIDSLTGILNRGAFAGRVGHNLQGQGASKACSGALLVIDVDFFKTVNDRFGHDRGDQALLLITQAIQSSLRAQDIVGRLGGEEFGVFIPWIDRVTARLVADQIRRSVAAIEFAPDEQACPLSVSIGIAMSDDHASLPALFRAADTALYSAKHAGRNRIVEHEPADFAA